MLVSPLTSCSCVGSQGSPEQRFALWWLVPQWTLCPAAALGAAELVTLTFGQTQWASLSSVNLVPLLTSLRVVWRHFLSVLSFPVCAIGIPSRQDQSLPWPLAR